MGGCTVTVSNTTLSGSITSASQSNAYVGGLIAVLVFVAVIVTLIMRANRAIDTEYQLD